MAKTPDTRKPRPKPTRPTRGVVDDVVIALGSPSLGTLICWVRGEASAEEVLEFYPGLAEALAVKRARAA